MKPLPQFQAGIPHTMNQQQPQNGVMKTTFQLPHHGVPKSNGVPHLGPLLVIQAENGLAMKPLPQFQAGITLTTNQQQPQNIVILTYPLPVDNH